jgi:hypothetical protein
MQTPPVSVIPANASPAPTPPWEKTIRLFIQIGFVLIGLYGVHTSLFMGQDWGIHQTCVEQTLQNPGHWFHFDVTSRPLIYWLAACCERFTHGAYGFPLVTILIVLANASSLWLLHDALRWSIRQPVLRLSALGLFAFLPVTSVATTVFAADNLTVAFFALSGWSLIRCLTADRPANQAAFALIGGLGLVLAQFEKFTFLLLPLGIGVAVAIDRWTGRRTGWHRELWIAGCMVCAPLLVGLGLDRAARIELVGVQTKHSYDWQGTGEMTWRSVLWPRVEDIFLLSAPTYWEPSDRPNNNVRPAESEAARRQDGSAQRLLQSNRYSYPGLLHLGVFSDVQNYSHPTDDIYRPEPQRSFARGSVRLGLLFSITGALACLVLVYRLMVSLAQRHVELPSGTLVWAVCGAVWYFPLVIQLPYLHHSYEWGYWLPRLVLPAIWSAVVVLFTETEQWIGQRKWPHLLIGFLTMIQIGLGIRSIWY